MVRLTDEKRKSRPRFVQAMLDKRSQKKRAPSFDGTVESSSSSLGSHRNYSPTNSQHNPSIVVASCISMSPIVIVEEEGRGADASLLKDALYKRDIALANRVAALNAQQLLLGENHPDVLFSLQNLAALHYRRGEYAQARRILEWKDVRRERSLQPDQNTTMKVPSEIFVRSEF